MITQLLANQSSILFYTSNSTCFPWFKLIQWLKKSTPVPSRNCAAVLSLCDFAAARKTKWYPIHRPLGESKRKILLFCSLGATVCMLWVRAFARLDVSWEIMHLQDLVDFQGSIHFSKVFGGSGTYLFWVEGKEICNLSSAHFFRNGRK